MKQKFTGRLKTAATDGKPTRTQANLIAKKRDGLKTEWEANRLPRAQDATTVWPFIPGAKPRGIALNKTNPLSFETTADAERAAPRQKTQAQMDGSKNRASDNGFRIIIDDTGWRKGRQGNVSAPDNTGSN